MRGGAGACGNLRAPPPELPVNDGPPPTPWSRLLSGLRTHPGAASWRVEAELTAAGDGYTGQSVRLFVAHSRQSMGVFG
jgi:hypothetical protein